MAISPSSLSGIVDIVRPALGVLEGQNPDVRLEVYIMFQTDTVVVIADNKFLKINYSATLLTRSEIEDGTRGWVDLVRERLRYAVEQVTICVIPDAISEEYDEILAASDMVADLERNAS